MMCLCYFGVFPESVRSKELAFKYLHNWNRSSQVFFRLHRISHHIWRRMVGHLIVFLENAIKLCCGHWRKSGVFNFCCVLCFFALSLAPQRVVGKGCVWFRSLPPPTHPPPLSFPPSAYAPPLPFQTPSRGARDSRRVGGWDQAGCLPLLSSQ